LQEGGKRSPNRPAILGRRRELAETISITKHCGKNEGERGNHEDLSVARGCLSGQRGRFSKRVGRKYSRSGRANCLAKQLRTWGGGGFTRKVGGGQSRNLQRGMFWGTAARPKKTAGHDGVVCWKNPAQTQTDRPWPGHRKKILEGAA